MVKANKAIFKFYLAMMDSISECLSKKYPVSSLDKIDHYKTIIIQKIVQMFHTLESIALFSKDEVSARCVLRGILDSVSVYCLIYNNKDRDEMMFRHYLYVLDGFSSFRDDCLGCSLDRGSVEKLCDDFLNQTEELINNHPYLKGRTRTIEEIIDKNNWKYKSLTDSTKLKYEEMYRRIGLDEKTSKYYQCYLSQFAHGLCLSNIPDVDSKRLQNTLLESIPLADTMMQAIFKSFPRDYLMSVLLQSDALTSILRSQDFRYDDLLDFAKALIRKD